MSAPGGQAAATPAVAGRRAAAPSIFERLPAVFQQPAQPLPGLADADLASAVGPGSMTGEGTSGDEVRLLQQLLASARHDPGADDGDFGARTQDAVRSFQRARRLNVDGVVGPQTIGELAAPFLRRFLDGLEDVVEPVIDVLDNLPAYVDIGTAPEHVLRWWAWLLTSDLVEQWPDVRRRDMVRSALELHQRRGTALGIRGMVTAHLGVSPDDVSIEERGDASWSPDPDAGFTGEASTHVLVAWRSGSTKLAAADMARLREALLATMPVGYSLALLDEA